MDTSKAIELNRKIIRIVTIIGIILTIILRMARGQKIGPISVRALSSDGGILDFILIQITQVVYPIVPGA